MTRFVCLFVFVFLCRSNAEQEFCGVTPQKMLSHKKVTIVASGYVEGISSSIPIKKQKVSLLHVRLIDVWKFTDPLRKNDVYIKPVLLGGFEDEMVTKHIVFATTFGKFGETIFCILWGKRAKVFSEALTKIQSPEKTRQ